LLAAQITVAVVQGVAAKEIVIMAASAIAEKIIMRKVMKHVKIDPALMKLYGVYATLSGVYGLYGDITKGGDYLHADRGRAIGVCCGAGAAGIVIPIAGNAIATTPVVVKGVEIAGSALYKFGDTIATNAKDIYYNVGARMSVADVNGALYKIGNTVSGFIPQMPPSSQPYSLFGGVTKWFIDERSRDNK